MTTTHAFADPAADTAEVCTCGAAFYEGYNRQAVKIAHLSAFLAPEDVAAQIVAPLTPGRLSDLIAGAVRLPVDRTLDLIVWNTAMDRENGYES